MVLIRAFQDGISFAVCFDLTIPLINGKTGGHNIGTGDQPCLKRLRAKRSRTILSFKCRMNQFHEKEISI